MRHRHQICLRRFADRRRRPSPFAGDRKQAPRSEKPPPSSTLGSCRRIPQAPAACSLTPPELLFRSHLGCDKDMGREKGISAAKLTDDIVVNILSRLEYKSFCRCKCVCKAWSAFSSDPYYCKKLPKKVTVGFLYQDHDSSAVPLVSLSQDVGEIDGLFADVPHDEHLEFLDCCNGLVLCKYKSSYTSPSICRFVVCNPATREWRVLPDTQEWTVFSHIHAGQDDPRYESIIAFDPSYSPHFYVFNFHVRHLFTSKFEIFSSCGSTWLVDDSWDCNIDVSWRQPRLFLQGLLYVGTDRNKVVVFKGLEAMRDGTPPYIQVIQLPLDTSYVRWFTRGCFGKSSGILHYVLPHVDGHSIIVWTLDDYAPDTWNWTVKCHLSMRDAFGRNNLVHYDDGGDGGDDNWFWKCDYQIVGLDMEKGLLFLMDMTTNKLLSYSISTGKLNEFGDGWHHYYYYVPCYSKLPSQELHP